MIDKNDLEVYLQLLYVPAYAFGEKEFTSSSSLNSSELEALIKSLQDIRDKEPLNTDLINKSLLLKATKSALDVINRFDDLHTLTSYTDEQVNTALAKLT